MEALIKIGGSLIRTPKSLRSLCKKIAEIRKESKICLVPGGSIFADAVREVDREYKLNNKSSHNMAILAMDQYGFILQDLIPNSIIFDQPEDYKKVLNKQKIPIFLPAQYFLKNDPLENSWNITSDSIAIHIAKQLKINQVIKVTDVDGIFDIDPKKSSTAKLYEKISAKELVNLDNITCIDKELGRFLLFSNISCAIVNGHYPKRVINILKNKPTICTLIT
ncbi:MAG: hypothetical protein AC479_03810 [miscellaneous Crenarchaeota group-6 archaeon AD8-1]|nr:MAG: hypothetical protein AC479_03810 [miscellaneous Crenarchaeota group-6 archaeon AD8-1]